MPILRLGNTLRLTGKDAEDYLKETGRTKLPGTVNEYNQAIQESINLWNSIETAEGYLLANIMQERLITI